MEHIMTKKGYEQYVEKKSPKSKALSNTIKAFCVGGLICVVGQFILNALKTQGYGQEISSNLTTLIMVLIGALLTGLNVYDDIGKFSGAGSIVPVTGFANSIVSPAMEFKSEGYVMGVGSRMFIVAGPVLVYGISTSVVIGVIYYLIMHH